MDEKQKQEEEADFQVLVHVHVQTRAVSGCISMSFRRILSLRGKLLQAAIVKLQGYQIVNGILSKRLSIVFPVAIYGFNADFCICARQ